MKTTTVVLFVIMLFLLFEKTESRVYRPEKSLQIYSLYFIDDG